MRDLCMWGMTPPPAIVALIKVSSSSSPRMASYRCLGVIRFTFRSFEAFPASSRTSAVRYSRIAAEYTAADAPTRPFVVTRPFSKRWIRPTGNYSPAFYDLETGFRLSLLLDMDMPPLAPFPERPLPPFPLIVLVVCC